jgi:hypothetical protein
MKKVIDYRIRHCDNGLHLPEIRFSVGYANQGFHAIGLGGYVHTTFRADYNAKNVGSCCWAANQLLDFMLHRLSIEIDFGFNLSQFPSKRNER